MVEDGVVDATFHDEPIAQVLPSSPFFALSPPTYTKYELAYPCGNDANTVRTIPSSRSRKKIVPRPAPGLARPGRELGYARSCFV